MPPPRKPSPRQRSRRSRSYSPKQSLRRRSRSHSRSPKKRSRSPHRKNYPKARNESRSPHRHSGSPKRRSRSPKRRSKSPKRRSRSPNYPVKRPADSSGKRASYRSRSRTPTKKLRDDRFHREPSPRHSSNRAHRSPSPHRQSPSSSSRKRSPLVGGKAYMDKPSSSKQPLFPVEKRGPAIDSVKIVDLEPKQKLDKRFQTLEQIAQGGFDFEENITIGIHRGPHHIELDNDVPVSYVFNPKTFLMLHPKRDYTKAIFDRDEIKAFHHDDILDEEAYVEKRTITVKPSEKQRPKWMDDYKITVGQDRESYGDKRMVQDSRSRRPRSRSPEYEPQVRLDPKPDPRYERLYRDQQRQERSSPMMPQEDIQRNPNDLRYSLNKRKSEPELDRDRSRDRDRDGGRFDARSKIEARPGDRWSDEGPERRSDRRDSPGRSFGEKRKAGDKSDLPDFKNRPAPPLSMPDVWIIGTDVVKEVENYKENGQSLADMLKDQTGGIIYHSDSNLKMAGILSAVNAMLEKHSPPHMIMVQCGENEREKEDYTAIMKDIKTIKEKIPNIRLVWSQTLLPLTLTIDQKNYKSCVKSHKIISRLMLECFNSEEVHGCFIYHHVLCKNFKNMHEYFIAQDNGKLGLSDLGLQKYVSVIKEALQYFISGAGTVFPYITWPPTQIKEIPVENMCMLVAEQLLTVTEAQLLQMSIAQIQQLSVAQLTAFSREQHAWLYCRRLVQNLTPDQVKKLRLETLSNLTLDQINLFLETQAKNLREDVEEALRKKRRKLFKGQGATASSKGPEKHTRTVGIGQVRSSFRGRDLGKGRGFNRGRGRGFHSSRGLMHKGFRQRDQPGENRSFMHKELMHRDKSWPRRDDMLRKEGIRISAKDDDKRNKPRLKDKNSVRDRKSVQDKKYVKTVLDKKSVKSVQDKKSVRVDKQEEWDKTIREKLKEGKRHVKDEPKEGDKLYDLFQEEFGYTLGEGEKKSPVQSRRSSSGDGSLSPWERETTPEKGIVDIDSDSTSSREGSNKQYNKNKNMRREKRSRSKSNGRDLSPISDGSFSSRSRSRRGFSRSRSSSSGSYSSYSSSSRDSRRRFRRSRSPNRHRYRSHSRDRSPYHRYGPHESQPPFGFPPHAPLQRMPIPFPQDVHLIYPGNLPPNSAAPLGPFPPHSTMHGQPVYGPMPMYSMPPTGQVPPHGPYAPPGTGPHPGVMFQGPPPPNVHVLVEGPSVQGPPPRKIFDDGPPPGPVGGPPPFSGPISVHGPPPISGPPPIYGQPPMSGPPPMDDGSPPPSPSDCPPDVGDFQSMESPPSMEEPSPRDRPSDMFDSQAMEGPPPTEGPIPRGGHASRAGLLRGSSRGCGPRWPHGPPPQTQAQPPPMRMERPPRQMGPGQIRGPGPGQMRGPNPGQMRGPNPGQLGGPNPGKMGGPGQMRGPNPGQMQGPNHGQMRGPYPGHMLELNPGQMRGLNPGHMPELNPGQMRGPNPRQMRGPNPGQMRGPNPGQIRGPNPGQIRGPNPGQIRGPIESPVRFESVGQFNPQNPFPVPLDLQESGVRSVEQSWPSEEVDSPRKVKQTNLVSLTGKKK